MKFSAQEEYGLRLLLRIAQRSRQGTTTIPELAAMEQLSEPHVAKLLMILRRAGFITSIRGQSGGYRLARQPEEIVIGAVLEALGGRLVDDEFCERHTGLAAACPHFRDCSLRGLWEEVQEAVNGVVYQRTLRDFLGDDLLRKPALASGKRPAPLP